MPAAQRLLQQSEEEQIAEDVRANSTWRLFWGLLLLAPVPLMLPYFIELWQLEWYRYFPFVFLAVGALVYLRSDRTFSPPRNWLSWSAVLAGLFFILVAAMLRYPWFSALGFVMIALACLHSMKGKADPNLLGLGLPLLLLLRPPFRSDNVLIAELQSITTWLSSVFLDLLAVPHATHGNVMVLAKRELFVAEACSGVQSVFTLAFLGCLLISWKRIRLWLFPVYLGVAFVLAVAANTIRVTCIAVADSWLGFDISSGWGHEILGYVCLLIGAGFLLSFDQLIAILFHQVGTHSENPIQRLWDRLALPSQDDQALIEAERLKQRDAVTGSRLQYVHFPNLVRWSFVASIALVVVVSVAQTVRSERRQTLEVGSDQLLFSTPDDLLRGFVGLLDIESHEVSRGNVNPRLGANADLWDCRAEGVQAQIVLSQPYSGWKELCVCYEGGFWKLVDRTEKMPEEDDIAGPDGSYAVGRFKGKDDPNQNAYLFFSAIRPDGTVMAAPTRLGSLGTRFMHRLDYGGVWELDDVMMLQMWVVSPRKLPPETMLRLQTDFVTVRSMLLEAVRQSSSAPDSLAWSDSQETSSDGDVR